VLATKNESVDEVKKKFSGNGSAAKAAEPPSQPRTPVRGEPRAPSKAREEEEGGGVPGGPLEQGRAQSRFESVQEPPEHTSEAMSREARQHVSDARGASG